MACSEPTQHVQLPSHTMPVERTGESALPGQSSERIQFFAQATASLERKASHASAITLPAMELPDEAQLRSKRELEAPLREQVAALKEQIEKEKADHAKACRELETLRSDLESTRAALKSTRAELKNSRDEVDAARAAMSGMADELKEIRLEQQEQEELQRKGREALRVALREQCFRSRAEAKVFAALSATAERS